MNIQKANFQDLVAVYYMGTTAQEAAEQARQLIQHKEHLRLAILLRDHRKRSVISPSAITFRAAIDTLLICYDVMEMAILGGFIQPPDSSDFWDEAAIILDNAQVRRYYETFYPVHLPQLLRLRLQRQYVEIEQDDPALASCFMEFLEQDRQFMTSLNNGYLLKMLDSFEFQGYAFSDVVKLIQKPEEYIHRILLPPEEREVPDQVLHELSTFMRFSFDLNRLLKRLDHHPLLQSEMWHHYSYWFGKIGKELKKKLGKSLDQFLLWTPSKQNREVAEAIQHDVTGAQNVLTELISSRYAKPVDILLNKLANKLTI